MIRLLLGWLLATLPVFAADNPVESQLLAIDSAFVDGQYAQVELLALRLLQSDSNLSPQEISRVDLTTGYSLIMLDREPEARAYFRRALEADPNLTLDPVQVSPKFRVVFDEVKAGLHSGNAVNPVMDSPRTHPPARSAMLSNLIIPGTGQWRDGRPWRGTAFLLAQSATVGLLIWQVNRLHDAHEDYLAETNPVRIRDAYDQYNRDYATAWGLGVLTAAVYLATQADLVLFRPAIMESQASRSLSPGVTIALRW